MKALELTMRTGEKIIINEEQVVSVHPPRPSGLTAGCTLIKMSNGEEYLILSPPYDDWHNDIFIK